MAVDIERLNVELSANIAKFESAMKRAGSAADKSIRDIEKSTERANTRISRSFSSIGTSIGGIVAVFAGGKIASEVVKLADAFTRTQNALKVAGLSGNQLSFVYEKLLGISQQFSVPLEGMASLYGRVATAQKALGVSSGEIVQLTTTVAAAIAASGKSAESASGALLGLGQALGAGKVQGDEFNQILEGAPVLAQAAADGFIEAGGSIGKLKQLMKDGEISSRGLFRAILAGSDEVQKKAAAASSTTAQAWQRVENALTDLVGKLDEAGKFSLGASRAMDGLANSLGAIAGAVGPAVSALSSYVNAAKAAIAARDGVGAAVAREAQRSGTLYSPGTPSKPNYSSQMRPGQYAVDPDRLSRPVMDGPRMSPGQYPVDPDRFGRTPAPISVKDKINTEGLGGGKGTGKGKGKGGGGGKSDADQVRDYTESLKEELVTLQAEQGALGKSNLEKQIALNLAEAGTGATDEQKQAIIQSTTAIVAAEEAIKSYEEAQKQAAEAARYFGDAAVDALTDLVIEGKSAEEVMQNLIKSIARAAIQAAIMGTGPLGGLAGGGLMKAFGFGTGKAAGGMVYPGRSYPVGENGPETFVPTTPGRIVSKQNGGNVISLHSSVDARGSNMTEAQFAALLNVRDQQLMNKVQENIGPMVSVARSRSRL